MEFLIFFVIVFLVVVFERISSNKKSKPSPKQHKNNYSSQAIEKVTINKPPANELDVLLTPEIYLTSNERKKREDIINCKTPILLDLVHEKDNQYDTNALIIFHDKTKIGYIAKKGVSDIVDNFSFDKNGLKNGIHLIWNGNKFLLTKKKIELNIIPTQRTQFTQQVTIESNIAYKQLYKSIPLYLQSKDIQRFYHFTDIKNLESIIENGGLYSWYGVQNKGIRSSLSSNELSRQLDVRHNLQNYVRLSFNSYHPMSSRLKHEEGKELIWLEIDLDVACWENTLFSDINATDNNVKVDGSFDFLKTLDLDIFKREYRDLDFMEKKIFQAEILVKDFLPIRYIKNIDMLKGRYL